MNRLNGSNILEMRGKGTMVVPAAGLAGDPRQNKICWKTRITKQGTIQVSEVQMEWMSGADEADSHLCLGVGPEPNSNHGGRKAGEEEKPEPPG
jgi:hypothetical protein